MAGGDGLSALPDDLLRRVLYFAPAKEAASTAVLSRRWRLLWRTSGAVNLDSRSYDRADGGDAVGKARAFARGMEAALAAAAGGTTIKRLTLHVKEPCFELHFMMSSFDCEHHDMVTAMLASPSARAAEELRVVIAARRHAGDTHLNFSELSFGSLPSETLRALRVANCNFLTPPPPAGPVFPRLAELRLRRCGVSIADLQRVIDAAPQLATLHLECYAFRGIFDETGEGSSAAGGEPCYRLLCPAVTAVVLADCSWPWKKGRLELDVPRLQYFRYKGHVLMFSFAKDSP